MEVRMILEGLARDAVLEKMMTKKLDTTRTFSNQHIPSLLEHHQAPNQLPSQHEIRLMQH